MTYKVIWTSKFKKDYKNAIKRGYKIELLDEAIRLLANEGKLPNKYKEHELTGNWKGFKECHVTPDWLLIYSLSNDVLVLTLSRTGSHSDLF